MLTAILGLFLCVGSIVLVKHIPRGWEQKLAKLLAIFRHCWEEFSLLLGLQISKEIVIFLVS